jgi:hypothetical protein
MATTVQKLQTPAAGDEPICAFSMAIAAIGNGELPFVDENNYRQIIAAFMRVIHVMDY